MGWLEINRTVLQLRETRNESGRIIKRQKLRHKGDTESTEATNLSPTTSLEALPKELLEKIFIYSENLDLVRVSRHIMRNLQPHFYLESQFILNQVNDGAAPVSVLLLPFVTRELLESLNLRNFEPMTLPHFILTRRGPELIAYLLECGLNTEDHALCYDRLIDAKYTKVLVNKKYVPSTCNLIKAIELGNKYTHRMVTLADLDEKEMHTVWNAATMWGRKRVLKALEARL